MLQNVNDPLWNTIPPEDFSVDRSNESIYSRGNGQQALQIAEKINHNNALSSEDLAFIMSGEKNQNLFLVIAQVRAENGNTIYQRFRERKDVRTGKESAVVTQTSEHIAQTRSYIPSIIKAIQQGNLPDGVLPLQNADLPEKEFLITFLHSIGLEGVYFVDNDAYTMGGTFVADGNLILLSGKLLSSTSRKRVEVLVHELAHFLQEKNRGTKNGYVNEARITHESTRGTPFADFYLLAANVLSESVSQAA